MTFTLLADGSSDAVLIPILTWSLRQNQVAEIVAQRADRGRIPRQANDEQRMRAVLDLYPCDILFVHRDAEAQPAERRRTEIAEALRWADICHIPVVPVRMTEAWLLVYESAIREAAGNPRGTQPLDLPSTKEIEELPDPKDVLFRALTAASGLGAHRRSRLPVHKLVHRIPDYISDYSQLLRLPAFDALQQEIRRIVRQ